MTDHAKYTHLSGPAIDALDQRKESDNGPTEADVTASARSYFRKFGPVKWSAEVLAQVNEICRTK